MKRLKPETRAGQTTDTPEPHGSSRGNGSITYQEGGNGTVEWVRTTDLRSHNPTL